jgi:hypothetical protein
MAKIPELEKLARDMIGDGKSPNLYFVTLKGAVVSVDTDVNRALAAWRALAYAEPLRECALEDRLYGVLASVTPRSDEDPRLGISTTPATFRGE